MTRLSWHGDPHAPEIRINADRHADKLAKVHTGRQTQREQSSSINGHGGLLKDLGYRSRLPLVLGRGFRLESGLFLCLSPFQIAGVFGERLEHVANNTVG